MPEQGAKERIAILGGGMAALTTAFELTRDRAWKDRFESITIYQMGWRLGGKCASSRGWNGRIEEHGIHGFLGSYYNTLPMMAACYDELARDPSEPLATFEQALIPQDFGMLWELRGRTIMPWAQDFPDNTHNPRDDLGARTGFELSMVGVFETIFAMLFTSLGGKGLKRLMQKRLERWSAGIGKHLARKIDHPRLLAAHRFWKWVKPFVHAVTRPFTGLRRSFVLIDHLLTMLGGVFADDVHRKGFDILDEEDFNAWLTRHGAHPETLKSPLNLNFINMTYQYRQADTSQAPTMAAGAYVRWALQSTSYFHSFIWRFAAGTGETLIAPLYQVLKRRGVTFEFFHKVDSLRLSADKRTVAAVDFDVQATLKQPAKGYEPLIAVKGLPSWPAAPLYDQLVEGQALQNPADEDIAKYGAIDLESYWTYWNDPAYRQANPTRQPRTLVHGRDYDRLVFAISIGAVEQICAELRAASPAWHSMTDKIPALVTQTAQIWLNASAEELGWSIPKKSDDAILSTTYFNPFNGQAELNGLIRYEDWPANNTPKGLWYFSGLMEHDTLSPPFDGDHYGYPRTQAARVKYQAIQYLQSTMGLLLPKASPNEQRPPGDPFGFDFDLLVNDPSVQDPKRDMERFDLQFWRANIDPTERYVASPPGSTQYRLKAWESGFDNLVVAGDWIHTGVNVGSVEGAVMSGKLASHALTGSPPLQAIVGYEV